MNTAIGQIDANVRIPAAVKAAAARSDAAFKQAYGSDQTPEARGEGQEEKPEDKKEAAAGRTEPEAAAPAVSAPATPPPADDQSWEHRYKSMKGRYDQVEARQRQLLDRIAQQDATIADLQVRLTQQPREPATSPPPTRFITDEDEANYGSDLLDVVGRKAQEQIAAITDKYERKIAQLEARVQEVGGTVAQSAQERMMSALRSEIPNVMDINSNPNFIAWLKLPDVYSGAIRHDLLKAAWDRNDTARVMAFFKGFLSDEAATAPAGDPPDPSSNGTAPAPKVPLETFAAPGRAKTPAATSAPAEKPIITRAQISQFYAEVAAGKYRGKDAEKTRLEQMVFEAEREGRIR